MRVGEIVIDESWDIIIDKSRDIVESWNNGINKSIYVVDEFKQCRCNLGPYN